ncbi:hypothetical protein [Pontiella sulfatireligans]|uniref:Uncharacterized protein n=1 Tax=Pontiella sulfatireligans TaxID=2750658 RepID=A0A6C2UEZ9_9BACT|nr:hypothetical protein [Pontiella sulfatireligans]VGO18792.1 hypothetical protein SCARR_00845 [Pontiella sulfatireligans]
MKEYGAYLTTEKIIAIELPERHHDSARHNREVRKAKADLLARNLRCHIDSGKQKPEDRWVLEKAVEVLARQSK